MRYPFFLCLIFVLLFTPDWAHGQSLTEKADSIYLEVKKLEGDTAPLARIIEIWEEFKYKDPDLAKLVLDKAEIIAKETGSAKGMAYVHANRGVTAMWAGNDSLAKKYFHQALAYFVSSGNEKRALIIKQNLIQLDYNRGRYQAVIHQIDSLFTNDSTLSQYPNFEANLNKLVGLSNLNLGNNLLAMKYFIKGEEYYAATQDSARMADNLTYLGNALFNLNKYEQSKGYTQAGIIIYQALKDWYFLAQGYNDYGNTLFEEGIYLDSATFYLGKSIAISQKYEFGLLPITYMNLGKV